MPFYHCFGMVLGNLACTTHGACIVIPSPGFEPAAALAAVQAERCTSLYGVPTMFIAELALPDFAAYDLSTLRTGIMAGSPCPVEVMKRVVSEMHMTEVTICYGMTETSPVSTQTRADDDMERRVSTVGRVHPHVEVKVIDPGTGLVVPRGTAGELCTRGYSVMLGYWDDEAQTDSVIDAARWMHTGDLAVMDAGGYLNIAGRIKDMVIRGGENVYPREVEEFLYTHPAIEDVQVIGVPDAKYGEELCAWVKLRPGAELSLEELREFCTGQIAHFKIPRYLRITEDFPMTVTGKVQKFVMREVSDRRARPGGGGPHPYRVTAGAGTRAIRLHCACANPPAGSALASRRASRSPVAALMVSTAWLNASSFCGPGRRTPPTVRTYWRAAACTSSSVTPTAYGARKILMLRHIRPTLRHICRKLWAQCRKSLLSRA